MKIPCRPTGPLASTLVTAKLKSYNMFDLKEKQPRDTLLRVSVKKMSKFKPVQL